MKPQSHILGATSVALLLIVCAVCGQRSSPQFSFPPPGAIASQFGADVFGPSAGLGQDGLGQTNLVQIGAGQQQASPQQQQQPQQQSQQLPQASSQQQAVSAQQVAAAQAQAQSDIGSGSLVAQSPAAVQPSIQLTRPRPVQVTGPQQQQPSHQSARHHGQTAAASSSVVASSSAGNANSVHRGSQSSSSSASHQASHSSHNNNKLHTQQTSQSAAAGSQQAAIESARKAEATAASQAASAGQNYRCPDSFGFFRHHKSCDKYYACENGTATLKLCGNGLMFDDSDPRRENCAYPFSVDCGPDRTDLEPPISTPHCPRLYGLFADTANCRVFYSCWNGEASKYECPPGLAYDNEQRVCVWADLVERCDQSEVSDGFVCPDPSEVDQPGHYTRHAHPTDCRKFYVCIEGVARPYGCSLGTVFNVDSLQCDEPENVSGCEKYYGDLEPKLAKKLAREGAQASNSNQPPASAPSRQTSSASSSSSSTS